MSDTEFAKFSPADGAMSDQVHASYLYDVTTMQSDVISMDYNVSLLNVTASNLSIYDLLERSLGRRYRSLSESVVLTVVYGLIFFTGLIGNVSTCIVITKNNYMHTATNYYLFSLAISDVMTLILGLPPELYTVWEAYPWRLGTPYCLFKTFLTEMTSSASILTIAAFTTERYIAICYPIKAQTMSNLSRAVKIIIGIWFAAAFSALPYPIHTRTYYYVIDPDTLSPVPDSLICNISPKWLERMRYVFQLSTFVLFIIPMFLITILYVRIGITLRKSGLSRQTSSNQGSPPHSQSRRAVLKMLGQQVSIQRRISCGSTRHRKRREIVHTYLVAVVVAFFICWAPFHSQRLMTLYISEGEWTPTLLEIQSLLFYTSGVLFFVSATVNPILYNLMSKKYRQAFRDTLCWCFRPRVAGRGYYKGRMRSAYERSTSFITYTQGTSTRFMSKRQSHTQSPLMNPTRQNPHRQLSDTSEEEAGCRTHGRDYRSDSLWRDRQAMRLSGHRMHPTVNGQTSGRAPVNGSAARGNVIIASIPEKPSRDVTSACVEDIEMDGLNMVSL